MTRRSLSLAVAVGALIAAFAVVIAVLAGAAASPSSSLRAVASASRPSAPDGLAPYALRVHDATPAAGAPNGWAYPPACCSDLDCRDVPADWIEERREGFRIVPTGEILGPADRRIRPSPDGRFHWCSVAGGMTGRTICLFIPPRSF